MASKNRSLNVLTLENQISVIKDHRQNHLSSRKLAKKYSCGKTQINHILSNADNLLKEWEENVCRNRKRKREEKYPVINQRVYQWFKTGIKGVPLTGALLKEKALEISNELGIEDFSASNGWLNRFRIRYNIILKGGKSNSSVSEQNNVDPHLLPVRNEEVITPDIEMQCAESTEMETQNGGSTSLLCNSDIIIKQEIIETELESNTFDNSSVHSSSVNGSSETQFDGQRPSASYTTRSEPSNSNTDKRTGGLANDPTTTTVCHGLGTMKVESNVSTISCDVFSKANVTFSNEPSILNVTDSVSSMRDESIQPRITPLVLNVTGSKNPLNNELIQSRVPTPTESPSSLQLLHSHGNSCNKESTQPEIRSHLNSSPPPRDGFDAFGEFVASKLRNLDPKSSAFVQTAFADIILKAELGIFQNSNENNISTTRTDGIQRDTPSHNESEITYSSSGKENIQPGVPSHIGNSAFGITGPGNSFRNQTKIPLVNAQPSFEPVKNNAIFENSLREDPIQPGVTPRIGKPLPSDLNVPERAFTYNPNQTRFPFHVLSPSLPPVSSASSWSNAPTQPRVPFHMRVRDEFDAYGEFAASKLRNLDPRSCAFVQTAFADLIFEAELGRFLSESEKSIFTDKTNNILRNMPSVSGSELSSLASVVSNVSRHEAQPRRDFVPQDFFDGQVPLELIPNLHYVNK